MTKETNNIVMEGNFVVTANYHDRDNETHNLKIRQANAKPGTPEWNGLLVPHFIAEGKFDVAPDAEQKMGCGIAFFATRVEIPETFRHISHSQPVTIGCGVYFTHSGQRLGRLKMRLSVDNKFHSCGVLLEDSEGVNLDEEE